MLTPRSLVVGLVSLGVFLAIGCQPRTPDFREANKQIVRDLYAAIDAQDYDRVRSLSADDAVGHMIGSEESMPMEAGIEMMQMFYAAFPDYAHRVDGMVAEGNWVAVRMTFHATHQADFQGIPATGNTVEYGGAHFLKLEEGLVTEWWLLENDLSLMQQIGMTLEPGGGEGAEG